MLTRGSRQAEHQARGCDSCVFIESAKIEAQVQYKDGGGDSLFFNQIGGV